MAPTTYLSPAAPGMAGDAVLGVLEQLDESLADFAVAHSPSDLEGPDFIAGLGVLESIARRVEGLQVGMAAQVSLRSDGLPKEESLAASLGCRNSVEVIQRVTRVSGRTAKARIVLGKATSGSMSLTGEVVPAKWEHVAGALEAGAVSGQVASMIVRTLEGADTSSWESLDYAQRCLLEAATGESEPVNWFVYGVVGRDYPNNVCCFGREFCFGCF